MSFLNDIYMFENDKVILVDTIDEFLSNFNLFDVSNPDLLNEITQLFADPANYNLIAQGGIGRIYTLNLFPNVVVKVIQPCLQEEPVTLIRIKECQLLRNGSIIYRVPNTNLKKTFLLCPDYITENLVGVSLYRLLNYYTPSVPEIFNFAVNTQEQVVFTSMERLLPFDSRINNLHDLQYSVFQVCQFLSAAQQLCKFTHYDLHTGNILTKQTPNQNYICNCYELNNGTYLYTLFDWDTVVVDFGFSRMETKNYIITPANQVDDKVQDNFEFNPYYDFISFFFHFINRISRNPEFSEMPNYDPRNHMGDEYDLGQRSYLKYVYTVLKGLINTNVSVEDLKNNNEHNFGNLFPRSPNGYRRTYWRFIVENLSLLPNRPISNPTVMLDKLASIYNSENNFTNHNDIINYLVARKFYVSDSYIKIPNNLIYPGLVDRDNRIISRFYPKIEYKDIIESHFYNYKKYGDNNLNVDGITIKHFNTIRNVIRTTVIPGTTFTLSRSMERGETNFLNQQITVSSFNQVQMLNSGYSYKFDCCRLDPRNYFQNSSISSGICINANFYRIFTDKKPVGHTKTGDIYFSNDIPTQFENYYGVLGINEYGSLEIKDNSFYNDFSEVITVGPKLVVNGNIFFNENMFETVNPNSNEHEFLFKSRNPRDGEADQRIFNDRVYNVTKIKPGELYHASNPNPRSAIAIKNNGEVLFIKVEGRDARINEGKPGVGMDLHQLAQFCAHLGAVNAINLDGGGSSQINWRGPNEDFITFSGGVGYSYLVGSIIALTKNK